MKPPEHICSRLNHLFLMLHAKDIAGSIDDDSDFGRLHDILRAMGAKDSDFSDGFLAAVLEEVDPARFEALQFDELPPASHTPLNSPVLRDWFFQPPAVPRFTPEYAICIGDSPFAVYEFVSFLLSRGVASLRYKQPIPIGFYVIGRTGWSRTDIDAIIDAHEGRNLQLFSQEMFLAALSTGNNPFAATPAVLSAFRAGHPGLEMVSEGWSGWVSTFVPPNHRHSSHRSGPALDWESESPLHAMGYRVGRNREYPTKRQAILKRAFIEELEQVGPPEYMAEWGEPDSAQRLHKIANLLASNCRNQKKRRRPSLEAIADWESDLDWLKTTFYHGRFKFQWPDTFVNPT
jgi:hypothetical protein